MLNVGRKIYNINLLEVFQIRTKCHVEWRDHKLFNISE
jgi:hypothetical protein